MKYLQLILIAASVVACGDDSGSGPTDDGSETTDPSTSTDPSSSGEPTTVTPTTTDPDTGSSSSSGSDSSGPGSSESSGADESSDTGEPAELVVEITAATAFMNCQPIVPPDPLSLMATLAFDNQGGAVTSAELTAVRLLDGDTEVATIELTPPSFGPFDAGETTSVVATKADNTLMPANGCGGLDCDGVYDLAVTFDVDGAEAIATGSVTIECAF